MKNLTTGGKKQMSKFNVIFYEEYARELSELINNADEVNKARERAKVIAYKLAYKISEEEYKKITANDGTSAKAVSK